ncbi:hypothetical protein [Nocardia phage P3.1]|nr:hypothetical protein [Nocardia phage P3.1]
MQTLEEYSAMIAEKQGLEHYRVTDHGQLPSEPKPLPQTEFRVMRRFENDSVTGKTSRIVITIDNPPSDDAAMIMRELVPDWLRQFGGKNKDYADGGEDTFHTADLLGARGQFADMWRKMGKLYRALWKGQEMRGEKSDEMVMDLIGHCFLTLRYLLQKGDK